MKGQGKTQLLVPLSLFVFLILVVPTPSVILSTTEHRILYQYNQSPNKTNLPKNFEICHILKSSNYSLHNHTLQPSQITHNSSQNKNFRSVGFQRTFWTYDYTASEYYELNATILAIGVYSYVFMQNSCITELGESVAIWQAETIRDEFDSTIYPRVTDLAGHPNGTLGDIDGDPRIIILLSRNPVAYYSERNEFVLDYSNQCEMFYMYYRFYNQNWRLAVTAHEFHHLIWFNNEMDEPPFTLEALAQYVMYHAGYLAPYDNLAPQVSNFLSHPDNSLLYWNSDSTDDYGSAYLFAFYIAEHYGVDILRDLIKEPTDGPQGIEAVLQAAGYNITFNELYLNWITALTIDKIGFHSNLYGFENIDAKITQYEVVDKFPLLNETISLRYYGFHIHKLDSLPDKFTVQIRKSSNQTIGVSLVLHDTIGWHVHQNIHDEADNVFIDNLTGLSIDIAYLITSYISNDTPPPTEYGLGPSTDIEISIIETPISTTNETDTHNTEINTKNSSVLVPGLEGITAFALFVILLLRRQKKKRLIKLLRF